jgi:hypothetical protein
VTDVSPRHSDIIPRSATADATAAAHITTAIIAESAAPTASAQTAQQAHSAEHVRVHTEHTQQQQQQQPSVPAAAPAVADNSNQRQAASSTDVRYTATAASANHRWGAPASGLRGYEREVMEGEVDQLRAELKLCRYVFNRLCACVPSVM